MCRTRHLDAASLITIASALAGYGRAIESSDLLAAIASQALWVYKNYKSGCRERRLREASQLFYDILTLEPLKEVSTALAFLSVLSYQALNKEPLASPEALLEAVSLIREKALSPEELASMLKGTSLLGKRPKNVVEALRAVLELEEYRRLVRTVLME